MRTGTGTVHSILAALLVLVPVNAQGQEIADLILKNTKVYTGNATQPEAGAVAIKANRIIFVGGTDDVEKHQGPSTRVRDLSGATVLPGLTDAHYHLSGVGQRELTLNLEGSAGLDDLLSRLKLRVDASRPGEWITGRGWIETFWKPQVFPTRWDLD